MDNEMKKEMANKRDTSITKMDSNKEEAIKAKEISEKKFAEMDFAGAKIFASRAEYLCPELDGLPQLIAALDVYISVNKKINGEVDWYGVLGVQPYADEDTIRKHYTKLALTLHQERNKSVAADGAFKILYEAWNLLSDKARRIAYDQRRNVRASHTNILLGQSAIATTGCNVFHDFLNVNSSNSSDRNATTHSTPAPPYMARNDTFWTTCNACKMPFQHARAYVNQNIHCVYCRSLFLAVETPAPPINISSLYTPFFGFRQQQKFCQVNNTGGGRFSGLGSSQNGAFPGSGSAGNINVTPPAFFNTQAVGVTNSASETLNSGRKESQTGTMTEGSLQMRFHPSKGTHVGLGTGSSGFVSHAAEKKERPKKRHIDATAMGSHMGTGNEGASLPSFHKSPLQIGRRNIAAISSSIIKEPSRQESRNILMEMAQKEIHKKLNSWKAASPSNEPDLLNSMNVQMKSARSKKPQAHKSMEYADIKPSIEPKKSCAVDSGVDHDTKVLDPPKSMSVPDPDFHDFDQDRTEKSFGENQVWAVYDDDDGMPRYYAMIHSVISLKPFKMRMSWLNSKSNAEVAPLNWIDSGFTKTSGEFWIGKHEVNRSLNSFSHKVKWSKGRKGAIQIYPRKGDVWALYRNWSSDWNALTPNEVIHQYDMVVVLGDYSEQKGVAVAPLVKVAGFKTVFHKHSESPSKTWVIPRGELFRFSHQVPSYLLTGQEGQNACKGCFELDPAAIPLELLQVFTETRVKETETIIGRTQEKTVFADSKTSKGKEIVENDQTVKPNASVEGVGQVGMEEEIQKEKENKKAGLLVYVRRQPGKRKS